MDQNEKNGSVAFFTISANLNLFVTVQLLEETSAVPSLGKLCEDHGYSDEWVSGHKPRLSKDGKKFICKTVNFVPLVVPRLSSISGASSSSTSQPQDSSSRSSSTSSSTSPSPALERSGEAALGNWCETNPKTQNKNKKMNGHRDSDDRLRDFSEWLQESAHISQGSGSERPTKVASTSRKHCICTHFPKDRICDICLRTKITKALCRRRTGEAVRRAEKFGDLKTADHKVLHEESESRNNHQYAVVVEDRATQWIQCCPCKTKTSPETENTKDLEPSHKDKPFTPTTRRSLAHHVKIYHGLTELQHLIGPRQVASLREPFDE